ncbi:hypothetical protein OEZ86_013476 [Tetradesmus obliquus]|nr:hypothetical protein OEZ86_013476 [Tetradesmus obliquus]
MDEGEAGAASSSGAAGEANLQDASAAGGPEQQEQAQQHLQQQQQQQQQQAQQITTPIPGARNYGYPDDFMMYAFKVEACNRTDKHPRGSCPYAHPGDVARRRHPSRYQALLCPEVRSKKVCPRMDECQCSHSAFEFWLHPDRYRTSMCYVPVQMQAAVDGSMVAQPAMQYAQASGRYYAPAAVERGGAPVLVMPAGQPQQQQQQQQQYVLQQAAAQQPPQLPEVVQQFQGLLVSSAPMTPQHQQQQQQYVQFGQAPAAGQWQHASGHQQQHGYEQQQQQMVMLMQPGVSGPQSQQQLPYAMQQPQMMYMQGPMEQASWSHG